MRRKKTGTARRHGDDRTCIRQLTLGFVMTIALGGCVAGPDFQRPQARAPSAWSASASKNGAGTDPAGNPEVQWWNGFADPMLTSLIERAAANPDLRIAALRILEARAERRAISATALPTVNGAASWQGQRVSEDTPTGKLFGAIGNLPGLSVSNPYGQYQVGFDASWELDLFGRIRRSVEAADAEAVARVEDRRSIEVALFGEIGRLYVDLRGAQLKQAVAVSNLATARELLGFARRRRTLGLSTEIDISRAAAQASVIEAQLPPLERQITADINELSRLIDREPGALRSELETVRSVPPAPPSIAVGLPAGLLCRRPDVRAAENRYHAAVARQGVAMADRFPRVTLLAAGGYQAQDVGNLLDWASRFGIIGPQISLPLFDAGRRRAKVEIETYRAEAARIDYGRTVLNALHEADGALTAYAEEQARRASLGQAVDQNRNAVRLARLRYQNGLDSILDVLDAERTLHDNELLLADSTTAVSVRIVALYKALGGGWQGETADADPCS